MGRKLLDAETWFERASFFHLAALELLVTRHGNNKALVYPAITLKAFATEAYFKSLIALEESARPADIHDLVILFGRLSSASRKSIRAQWDRETRPILLKARQNPPSGITVPTTLQKALEMSFGALLAQMIEARRASLSGGWVVDLTPARSHTRHPPPCQLFIRR